MENTMEGILLIDAYGSLRRCEDAIQIELKRAKRSLIDWLKGADEKLIAKLIEIEVGAKEKVFELLVTEVGLVKAKEVLKHMHYEFQKVYYKQFIL